MEFKLLDRMQARVALMAIGRATLRSQGAPGVVAAARKYLRRIDLREFAVDTRAGFERALDKHTLLLMKRFPSGAHTSWGGARKALNIFLRDALYSRFLSEHYRLGDLESWLELPLDSNTYAGLVEDVREEQVLPRWPGVKKLDARVNKELQTVAENIARQFKVCRVHLDVKYWRRAMIDAL